MDKSGGERELAFFPVSKQFWSILKTPLLPPLSYSLLPLSSRSLFFFYFKNIFTHWWQIYRTVSDPSPSRLSKRRGVLNIVHIKALPCLICRKEIKKCQVRPFLTPLSSSSLPPFLRATHWEHKVIVSTIKEAYAK